MFLHSKWQHQEWVYKGPCGYEYKVYILRGRSISLLWRLFWCIDWNIKPWSLHGCVSDQCIFDLRTSGLQKNHIPTWVILIDLPHQTFCCQRSQGPSPHDKKTQWIRSGEWEIIFHPVNSERQRKREREGERERERERERAKQRSSSTWKQTQCLLTVSLCVFVCVCSMWNAGSFVS